MPEAVKDPGMICTQTGTDIKLKLTGKFKLKGFNCLIFQPLHSENLYKRSILVVNINDSES